MHDQLDRPGPVRVRLRLNSELDQRLKTLAKTRGVGYTSLARSFVASGVVLGELADSIDGYPEFPGNHYPAAEAQI